MGINPPPNTGPGSLHTPFDPTASDTFADQSSNLTNAISATSLWPSPQKSTFNENLPAPTNSDQLTLLPLASFPPLPPPEEFLHDLTEAEDSHWAPESRSIYEISKAGELSISGSNSLHSTIQLLHEHLDFCDQLQMPRANIAHCLDRHGASKSTFMQDFLQGSKALSLPIAKNLQKKTGGKVKQGLAGFANGSTVSAMADTGSRKNVISAAYAEKLGLKVEGSPCSFTLGSSRRAFSLGTVSLLWSFSEDPRKTMPVTCHVLLRCIYDLILGNGFLTATETMSKYRHRLSQCLFSMANKLCTFAFLGETCQRLEGTLADVHNILAVPDSGAERNVMSLRYAIDNNLHVKRRPEHRNWLQFADGSYEETVGQVDTYWTFATGERIPVTFEILEECCSDVIIGEDICAQHNVFEDHTSSLVLLEASPDSYELAPFDFISGWHRAFGLRKGRKPAKGQGQGNNPHVQEQRRRDIWNYQFDYGASASTGEKELEAARKSFYESGPGACGRMPTIPSIVTAPSGRRPPQQSDHRSEGSPRQ